MCAWVGAASQRPDLVRGLFLMNPTPFWGVGIQRVLPWTGGYPVPTWVRPVTITWWDTIRNPGTIGRILGGVYANKDRVGQELIQSIIEPTEAPAAASAFASILCSPSSRLAPHSIRSERVRPDPVHTTCTHARESGFTLSSMDVTTALNRSCRAHPEPLNIRGARQHEQPLAATGCAPRQG